MAQGRYVVDHERAEWVIKTLIDAWRQKLPPFDHAVPVPEYLPKTLVPGSVEHALWLMAGLPYMRGRIDSAQAYIRLTHVYDLHPWMFDPETFRHSSMKHMNARAKMHKILRENGLGFNVRETIRFWDFNFKKLARFWDGNPLKIFKEAGDYDALCKLFMEGKKDPNSRTGFMVFRHKMVSMYIYFLTNAGLIEPFMYPGPVDTHNIRVMASTGMIKMSEVGPGARYEFYEVSPIARGLYQKYCKTLEDVLDLANALWYLSRDFCSRSQGNSSSTSGYRGRATEVWAKRVKWTPEKIRQYNSTCGQCSVESVCRWSLPSATQYNQGFLQIRSERPKPHTGQESLVELKRSLRSRGPKAKARKWAGEDEFPHSDQGVLFE
ncbi:hypothetical protein KW790_02300 [Candidatus Parcubacteria bacterium]|nr:hypothetical protein [Candidatus Parcubacteria bacterium]